jgi:hypothetical protein
MIFWENWSDMGELRLENVKRLDPGRFRIWDKYFWMCCVTEVLGFFLRFDFGI